jgi:hypothetical protein
VNSALPPLAHEFLHELPGIWRQVVAIVGRDAVAAERLRQAFDAIPVQLQAGANHQMLVLDHAVAFQHHRVGFRFESRDSGLDPRHAARQDRSHRARGMRGFEHAAAHQCPARLVIVDVGRVDDGDVEAGLACQQAGCHGNARGAAADDDDGVAGIGLREGCFGVEGQGRDCMFFLVESGAKTQSALIGIFR